MAFGAMGHHFPGFLRAYTDQELFSRFRLRFLLAPPAVFAAFLYFSRQNLYGMALVVALWGLWHGMMQHYGFMRIYDAKVGARMPAVARWDWWICAAWFGVFFLCSPGRYHNLLEALYRSGCPLLPAGVARALPTALVFAAVGVTAGYILRQRRFRAEGTGSNPVKFRLLVATLAFLGVVFLAMDDLLLGLVAWELYHDIQYLAVVWLFNTRRTAQGAPGWALKRLFRPGRVAVLLYVGLCLAWGGLGFAGQGLAAGGREILAALLGTSAVLHFYFDGFIWKVREADTSKALGIDQSGEGRPGRAQPAASGAWLRPLRHPLAFGLVLLLLFGFGSGQAKRSEPEQATREIQIRQRLAESVPRAAAAQLDWGVALHRDGRHAESESQLERTLRLDPDCLRAHNELGILLNARGRIEDAERHFTRARDLNRDYAPAWSNLSMVRLRLGDAPGAEAAARAALERAPVLDPALNNLGAALAVQGKWRAAQQALQRAALLDARAVEVQQNLALLPQAERSDGRPAVGFHLRPAADRRLEMIGSGRRCGNHLPVARRPTVLGLSSAEGS